MKLLLSPWTPRNKLATAFLALAIMLPLAVPAKAAPYEDAQVAYDRGDHTTALSQAISIEAAEFLVFLYDSEDNEQFVLQSDLVPLIPDRVCYGWRIRLAGSEGLVRFKEVFSLPAESEVFWAEEIDEFNTTVISKDRITAVTEMFITLRDGWIDNTWCVEDGDPEGKHSMEVHINGQFAKRFDFQVRDYR